MANTERGEMRLVSGDQEYTLFLTTNAACDLEDRSGRTLDQLTAALQRGSISALRWLLWGALQDRHRDTVKVPEDVGRIIDGAGGIVGALAQMTAFLALNAPPEPEANANGNGSGSARPPETPAVESGDASTSTPVN
jgi:hypothetical protein